MKRKVVSLLLITLPLLLAAVILQVPVTAAPVQQTVPAEEAETQLAQPQQIIIHQQVPLTFTVVVSSPLTGTSTASNADNLIGALINSITRPTTLTPMVSVQTVGVTLTLDLQLTVTDTLTTTVPSTVTLTLTEQQTTTIPISVTVGPVPGAAVVITLLAPPELPPAAATEITETVAITPGVTISPTVSTAVTTTTPITAPSASTLVAITGTIAITANLRAGPDTTFDALGTTTPGQTVTVVARNADSTWYLLDSGVWIAAFLVENVQGQLPLATDELVTTLRTQSVVTTTTPVTPTVIVTATTPVTTAEPPTTTGPILVPTPTATPQPAQPPRVTVNANLRAGPGTEFPIIGGTITGQEITIVARNADATWFRLDNGGWVSASLVANPPAAANVPLFTEDGQTDSVPTATPTAIPTPVPAPTATTTVLGVRENLYIIRVDGIVNGYDFTLTKIDELVTQASANEALLQDRAWIVEMTTAITLLRSTSDEVTTLSAPALFADAHADLVRAAASFTTAADLLAEGVDQLDTERLDEAFAEITIGSSLLTRVQNAIDEVTP